MDTRKLKKEVKSFRSGILQCSEYTPRILHLHCSYPFRYAAELHLVHFKTEYGSLTEAVAHNDGLAVLGIMLLGGLVDNPKLTPIIDGLATITNAGVYLAVF